MLLISTNARFIIPNEVRNLNKIKIQIYEMLHFVQHDK
jgi:hypothetical protein